MELLDWGILIGYLAFAFAVGIMVTKKAGKGLASYFVADRSLPWWWIGISIIATTFAADTPLAITGLTANSGIAGNWLWWSWAITYMTVTIIFASRWRRSQVLTDVEFIELRYEGKEASFLRGFKAVYFGLVINCFILGWVMTAMTKITRPFISWEGILGASIFETISAIYPSFLLFNGDLNTTITILLVTVIVVIYSSLGGIRGVILTDLFQFALAMITAVIFAVLAVNYVGGLEGLYSKMDAIYGKEQAGYMLEFIPSFGSPLLPVYIFLIYVFIQWWARYDSDGTGYIAQRLNTAKTPRDAQKGSLLFTILFTALRSWPWIMVALVAMVVFPLDDPTMFHELGSLVDGDRESGYPVLMKLILPVGLLGLTFTSLMAAFMSTVDTHLNWGSSYIVNDVYKRFINKEATQKDLVRVSRITVIAISILAILVSSQMTSIEGAWKFFWNMASGLGVAQLLRWLWWRSNATTEIASMLTALLYTFAISWLMPDLDSTVALLVISLICLFVAIWVTLITKPVSDEKLQSFVSKVKPVGFWGSYAISGANYVTFGKTMLMWLLGVTASYSALFSIGHFLKFNWLWGSGLVVTFIISFVLLVRLMNKQEDEMEE